MVRSTKSQRMRDKIQTDIKRSKQTTLEDMLDGHKAEATPTVATKQKKQIEIAEICTSVREDELTLKVVFRLLPSRASFSRVNSEVYFDEHKIDSLRLRILQGPLATDESEFSSVLDMTGIGTGQHIIKVEIYERWSSGEKLTNASKEAAIEYVPLKRDDRLIKIPIIKSVVGAGLVVVSESEKSIYREIEEEMKRDSLSRRDNW